MTAEREQNAGMPPSGRSFLPLMSWVMFIVKWGRGQKGRKPGRKGKGRKGQEGRGREEGRTL